MQKNKAYNTLLNYTARHGKAKTAVALGVRETTTINGWIYKKRIPHYREQDVLNLKIKNLLVKVTEEVN